MTTMAPSFPSAWDSSFNEQPDALINLLVAGDGRKGDGPVGDSLKCRMDRLHGIFVDRDGAVYIGDTNTHRIRVVRP